MHLGDAQQQRLCPVRADFVRRGNALTMSVHAGTAASSASTGLG